MNRWVQVSNINLHMFIEALLSTCIYLRLPVASIQQVLMWKTNFDKTDYSDVLQSHNQRVQGDAPHPTVADIPPRVSQQSGYGKVSRASVKVVLFCL